MSLTRHLADPDSPVRVYFAHRFPGTRELKFAHTSERSDSITPRGTAVGVDVVRIFSPPAARILPANEALFPWSIAGMALDYRLRYEFEAADPSTFAAHAGWTHLVRLPMGERATDTGWEETVRALARLTNRMDPSGDDLAHPDELELARLCGLLSLYEQVYRMGGILNPRALDTPIWSIGLNAPLEDLLGLVDDRVPGDVAAMIALFRAEAPELRSSSRVVANPEFARSRDLGGADADIILDHLLLELKTIKTAKIGQSFAWQVLGYLLADTDDEYEISDVGWYYARQGYTWRFPTDEFLRRLAGTDVDLGEARAEFADVCASLRDGKTLVSGGSTTGREFGGFPREGREHPVFTAFPSPIRTVERRVRFYPTKEGRGRWHAPRSQVPWIEGYCDPIDMDVAACGTPIDIDIEREPAIPPIGIEQKEAEARFCRRCLLYTEMFYASRFDPDAKRELADLNYYPPIRGSGKWHLPAGTTGYFHFGIADDEPACHAFVTLDLSAEPLGIAKGGDIADADPRLCRRCLKTPPRVRPND